MALLRSCAFVVLVASAGCGSEQPSVEAQDASGVDDATPDAAGTTPMLGGPCATLGALGCQGTAQKLQLLCNGTIWVANGVCPGDMICDARPGPTLGSCQTPTCPAGKITCEGATLVVCEADMLSSRRSDCASEEHCKQAVDGRCAKCLAGEARCEGAALMKCDADRAALVLHETCATAALCSATAGACTAPSCAVDEYRCTGDVLEKCNADRTAFETVSTCSAGRCDAVNRECDDCAPGAADCVGTAPRVCNSAGHWSTLAACSGSTPLCSAGTCTAGVCGLDEYRCSGDVLQKCNATFSGFVSVASCFAGLCDAAGKECDDCKDGAAECVGNTPRACTSLGHWKTLAACSGSTPLCRNGVCEAGVCSAGEVRCGTAGLETCKSDLSGFELSLACAPGTCNAALKQCDDCKPGETTCLGDTPQTCGSNNRWTASTTCSGTTPVCRYGGCIPSPKGWITMAGAGLSGRQDHTAVWTGTEMIIYGGKSSSSSLSTNHGAYNPSWDTWSMLPTPPIGGRAAHVAVWTGTHMIVQGGSRYDSEGAMYEPVSKTWTRLPTTGAPSARTNATAVWSTTTSEMLVWGGINGATVATNGARFKPSPSGGEWLSMAAAPSALGPRWGHAAIWTGTRMVVFGGRNANCTLTSGFCAGAASYDPVTDAWTMISPTTTMLDARADVAGVALGGNALIWGGIGSTVSTSSYRNNGAIFDGTTWKAMAVPSDALFPDSRRSSMTAWAVDQKVFVWGGIGGTGASLANGAVYDATTSTWAALPDGNAPSARSGASVVWTGRAAIVWGGVSDKYDGKMYWP